MAFIYDLSDTWNAGATTFTAIKMNVTDTASAAGSKLIDLQVGGTTRFDVDKNGQVEISAGTALLPSLSTLGDTNTGMWFPAADTIAWSTAGSERTRIDSSGRFLIGSDTAILSAFQGAGFTPSFQSHGATGGAASYGLFNWATGASSPYTITFNKSISGIVGTRGALTGGTSLANLVFNGDNGTTFSTAAAMLVSIDATPSSTSMPGRIEFYTTPTGSLTSLERMRIRASGNVGIGTTAPDALLSVNGIASFGSGAVTTPSVTAFGDLNTGMWFPAADTIAWSTGGTERLRITSAGRVGIGTSAPNDLLDVREGNFRVTKTSGIPSFILRSQQAAGYNPAFAQFTRVGANSTATPDNSSIAEIRFDGLDASNAYAAFAYIQAGIGVNAAGGAPGYFAFYTSPSGSVAVERLRIDSSGNVGINTAVPTTSLSVNGVASFGAGTAALPSVAAFGDLDTGMWFPAANTLAWSTSGSERMRITSAGNLGLGTSTFGTSAATVFAIATGTAPTTGPADTIQIYSTDLSAGNTMLSLYTEGTVVNANTTAAATHRIAIRVNGTVYYLLANTSST